MELTPVIGVIIGLGVAWLLFVLVLWALRPRDARLADLLRVVPDIARLCRDLLVDPEVPLGVRVAIAALLGWLLNPVDLIPELIPVLGALDDVVVAVLVLRYVRRRLGVAVLQERWRGTAESFRLLRSVMG